MGCSEKHGVRDGRKSILGHTCLRCRAIVKCVRAAGEAEKYFVQEIAESI